MEKTLNLLNDFILESNETNSNTDKINVIKRFAGYPEIVKAFEWGHSFRSSVYSSNLNVYYTQWENKPSSSFDFSNKTKVDVKLVSIVFCWHIVRLY